MKSLLTLTFASLLALVASSCSSSSSSSDLPIAKNEALWTGTWKSEQRLAAHGRISAAFPKKPPIDQPFKVKAKISYSPLSLYRPGHVKDGTFEAMISKNRELIGSNAQTPLTSPVKGGFAMKLKGNIANSKQIITYLGDLNPELTAMEGEFESDYPSNQGSFQISKTAKK